ncbi:MAG: cytochrome c oxidase cbb3-type subunit 1, partial [Bermanella sp.]
VVTGMFIMAYNCYRTINAPKESIVDNPATAGA